MAKFSFGKRSQAVEDVPPEPIDGEVEVTSQEYPDSEGRKVSRPLILAGIGVVLIGGLYLANSLFLSPPSPPPTQRAAPVPAVPETKAPSPVKEVKPTPVMPVQPVVPNAPETKAVPLAPSAPAKPAPATKGPAVTAPLTKPEPSTKSASPQAPPAKAATRAMNVEARTAAKATPAAGGFSIQVGAMAMEQNAETLKQKLEAMGFPAVIRKGTGYLNRHLVTAGDPVGKSEAEDLARRLNVDGFPSQLIALEGKYTPQAGAFVNLDEAIDLARELQKKGYHPKITSKPSTAALYQVRTGRFDTRAAAMKQGEELKSKGFNAWVVPN